MNRHILIWGWLRLVLGIVQTSCSFTAIILLIAAGLEPVTWLFGAVATAATISSRLLYHGRPDPKIESSSQSLKPNWSQGGRRNSG